MTVITSDYNLNLNKTVVNIDEIETIGPNDTLTYRIYFDGNDFVNDITDITVVDILPDEVSFVSGDSNEVIGEYDPVKHTYTWLYPYLEPESAIEMRLNVQVNHDVAPGTTITNYATINSNETPPKTANVDVVSAYNPLNVNKGVVGASDSEVIFLDETANGTEDFWWVDEDVDYPHLWWELIAEN